MLEVCDAGWSRWVQVRQSIEKGHVDTHQTARMLFLVPCPQRTLLIGVCGAYFISGMIFLFAARFMPDLSEKDSEVRPKVLPQLLSKAFRLSLLEARADGVVRDFLEREALAGRGSPSGDNESFSCP